MDTAQQELIERLRARLTDRAWLADDHVAYREGVEDALTELIVVLDEQQLTSAAR